MDYNKLKKRTGFVIDYTDIEMLEKVLSYTDIGKIIIGLRDYNLGLENGTGEDIKLFDPETQPTSYLTFEKMKSHSFHKAEQYQEVCKRRVNKRYSQNLNDDEPPNISEHMQENAAYPSISEHMQHIRAYAADKTILDKTILDNSMYSNNNIGGMGGKEEEETLPKQTQSLYINNQYLQSLNLSPIRAINKNDYGRVTAFFRLFEEVVSQNSNRFENHILKAFIEDMLSETDTKKKKKGELRKFYKLTSTKSERGTRTGSRYNRILKELNSIKNKFISETHDDIADY